MFSHYWHTICFRRIGQGWPEIALAIRHEGKRQPFFEDKYVKKTLIGAIALALVAVFGSSAIAQAAPAAGHKVERRVEHKRMVHKRIVRRRIVHRRVVKKAVHRKEMVHGKKK